MKLIHLSDIHLTTPGATISGRDPNANLDRALAHILADHADAELMVITGDLSDWGELADYTRLRERIAAFPIPTRLCIGNHDRRETFLQVFPNAADANGFVQGLHDTSMGRCLFLDTVQPGSHGGSYCEARQDWLDARLGEHDGPFFIFMHHHPMPIGLAPIDSIRLSDDVAFRAIIGRHRDRIRHIFFGHCHLPLAGSVSGVPTTSLRGTNHQSYPLFREAKLLTSCDLPESYGVAFIADDYTAVHMIEFGYAGEIRTSASPDYNTWNRETMVR